jgi:hypothetical protein
MVDTLYQWHASIAPSSGHAIWSGRDITRSCTIRASFAAVRVTLPHLHALRLFRHTSGEQGH